MSVLLILDTQFYSPKNHTIRNRCPESKKTKGQTIKITKYQENERNKFSILDSIHKNAML